MGVGGRSIVRRVVVMLLVVAACGALGLGGIVWFERQLIFFPSRSTAAEPIARAMIERAGLHVENVWCTTEDGVRLHGWWVAREKSRRDAAVLWFHGNAGNLFDRAELLIELARRGPPVLLIDYRGYGRSAGRPSEAGLERDALAAWRYLTGQRSIAPGNVVLFGKSLGGAVAVALASSTEPAGLIVQSSFTSIPEMAVRHYPFVPRALIRTQMRSRERISQVRCPVLVVHGRQDEIVPYEMGESLYKAAPEPKQLYTVEGAGHNDTWIVGGEAYLETMARFIAGVLPDATAR